MRSTRIGWEWTQPWCAATRRRPAPAPAAPRTGATPPEPVEVVPAPARSRARTVVANRGPAAWLRDGTTRRASARCRPVERGNRDVAIDAAGTPQAPAAAARSRRAPRGDQSTRCRSRRHGPQRIGARDHRRNPALGLTRERRTGPVRPGPLARASRRARTMLTGPSTGLGERHERHARE